MAKTAIEWTQGPGGEPGFSFNPWVGCTKVSTACDRCYAEAWAKRAGDPQLWDGERRRTTEANWKLPLKWNAQAAERGERYRVFCASLADVFDNVVPDEWRADLFRLILRTPSLTWLLLSKRIGNAAHMLPHDWRDGYSNVWLGSTVVTRDEFLRDVPKLRALPASIRFLSVEPMVEDLGEVDLTGIHWTIAGSESGPKPRVCDVDWVRHLRDQCIASRVPFFWKQHLVGRTKLSTPQLDGRSWVESPL